MRAPFPVILSAILAATTFASATHSFSLGPGGWVMVELDETQQGEECHYVVDYEVRASGVEGELLGILMKAPEPGGGGFEDLVTTRTGSLTLIDQAHWVGTCADPGYFFASNGELVVDVSITNAEGIPFAISFSSTGTGTIIGSADTVSAGTAQVAAEDIAIRAGWAHVELEGEFLDTATICGAAGARAVDVKFPGEESLAGLPHLPGAGVRAFAGVRVPGIPICLIPAGASTVASALGATRADEGRLEIRVASVDLPADVDVHYANVPMGEGDYPPGFFHGYYWVS